MAHRPAPKPDNELDRLSSLLQLQVLDTPEEPAFDDVVKLASTLCDTPIALVSLVDRERQWFKACIGLDAKETHRDLAFCAHAILAPPDVLVVEDATQDPRFKESALVLGPPFIRFYAGAPICADDGHPLGTVCVIDSKPRTLEPAKLEALKALARQTAALLQLRVLDRQREIQATQLHADLEKSLSQNLESEDSLRHLRRVSALGAMTASVAHDFNNVLHATQASLQMIQLRARRPDDVERFCVAGLQAVDKGRVLVSNLLSGVRRDGPQLTLLSVCERIEAMRELLIRTVGDNIKLMFQMQARGAVVLCDEAQWLAATMNLLANARDALGNLGEIIIATHRVKITKDSVLEDGEYVELSVSDNGPGMSDSVLARIFEPFYTTKAADGTGLGLSQVLAFARETGGDVRVRTALGAGTTVSLFLHIVGQNRKPAN